ncbi:hypothetical protein O1611_g6140 [Lasiodiplodia mahajangana]|uniref:Uncharacterized protein n=1 Tax=Lasiodiplodia mahajangana TaxID=1108764 RepID=A0ACC2JJT3_9PEZI|nr:hypothetical protein O1611_g6140 [Lasiodiplodia mahajangana]
MLGRLEEHDRHLKSTFDTMSEYASAQQHASKFSTLGQILKKQYAMCKETTHELEELYEYTEAQGWKLLVTALGAEINYFHGLKAQLADTLRFVGWADGVVTPQPGTPSRADGHDGDDLLGMDHDNSQTRQGKGLEEDLTGSILRRWDGTADLQRSTSHISTDAQDHPGETEHHGDSDNDNDNEVPPGLFAEAPHESEDEHNEVPPEFLSMHSPSPRSRGKGKGKMIITAGPRPDPIVDGLNKRETCGSKDKNGDEDEEAGDGGEATLHPLSRESSANEVPPDLLAESHRSID